jgi:OOP family OmpA-OmpF porin
MADKAFFTPSHAETEIPASAEPHDGNSDLGKLRELLFAQEIERLKSLQKRLDNPIDHARDTSEVIAEALLLRAQKDNMLYTALGPLTEKLFKEALRKSPMDFVNVLFPLMGPAIRQSVAETFHSMLESFHRTVELVFSWKSLRWRWEALRTGTSFSEVVALHTLVYRVNEVFFIHMKNGLPLCHVYNEGVTVQDTDMVSAMFTAIQDFARDSFAGGPESHLDALRMSEFTILLERGSTAYLACVVRGVVSPEFRERLRNTMATLQIKFADELDSFSGDGDVEKFASAHRYLEDLLDARYVDEDIPLPLWVKLLPVLILLLLIAGGGYFWYDLHQQNLAREESRNRMEENFAQVGREPGILLVESRQNSPDHWDVIYQKDPLARDPRRLLDARGVDPKNYTLRVIPFVSYEADMVTRRVKERITPPESVNMEFGQDGTLRLSGKASVGWILRARQEALALPGVEKVDISGVSDPSINELKSMIARVESTVVEFPLGKDTPVPEDVAKLTGAVDTLVRVEKLAATMNVAINLTVYGHADATGNDKRNYEISLERARTIAAMLYARGSSIPLVLYGLGSEQSGKDEAAPDSRESGVRPEAARGNQSRRKVEFKVHVVQLPPDNGMLNISH